jgi:N-acyl-D-amino-acid deacylase
MTAVAVIRLVQEDKIHLDDHPFTELAIPPLSQPGQTPDPRFAQITVLELLQHRGGFDRKLTPDPMYRARAIAEACGIASPAMQTDIIRYMEGRPLDFAPGERFAYSNFGYCVLGQLIEKVTGKKYEDYVQTEILEPMRIHSMRQGKSLLADRAPSEVRYYTADNKTTPSCFPPGETVPAPYGDFCLESHDSCGGWIASAADLVKFQSSFDTPNSCPILNPQSVAQLFARPQGPTGLEGPTSGKKTGTAWTGCGWSVNQLAPGRFNIWKNGKFFGTSAMMEHQPNGVDWAILLNQDTDDSGNELSLLIAPLIHRAVVSIQIWPGAIDYSAIDSATP